MQTANASDGVTVDNDFSTITRLSASTAFQFQFAGLILSSHVRWSLDLMNLYKMKSSV